MKFLIVAFVGMGFNSYANDDAVLVEAMKFRANSVLRKRSNNNIINKSNTINKNKKSISVNGEIWTQGFPQTELGEKNFQTLTESLVKYFGDTNRNLMPNDDDLRSNVYISAKGDMYFGSLAKTVDADLDVTMVVPHSTNIESYRLPGTALGRPDFKFGGVQVFADGNVYAGQWELGQMHGYGTLTEKTVDVTANGNAGNEEPKFKTEVHTGYWEKNVKQPDGTVVRASHQIWSIGASEAEKAYTGELQV